MFLLLLCLKLQLIVAEDTSEPKTALCVKQSFHNVDSPIATDASKFLEFVYKSDVYVDRSLLIKDLLKVKRPIVRITYPSKWGKSTCLQMLKTFFEIDTEALNNKSVEYPQLTTRPSYKYFVEGKITLADSNMTHELKNPPLISSQESIIEKYLGKYPVIYLDLSKCKGKNIEMLLLEIKQSFEKTFHEHLYLKDAMMTKSDSKMMNSLLTSTHYNESRVTKSLRFLSRMLCKYNSRKAFIFIDGFDTVINQVYFSTGSKFKQNDKERMINFTIQLLQNSFIDNDYLEKAVITGMFEVLQHRCFNSTKYVKPYNLLNPSEFFAMNKPQVREIFQHVNLPSDLSEKAIEWYAGYKMNKNKYTLFNSGSIAEFLKTKHLSSCWDEFLLKQVFEIMVKYDHFAYAIKVIAEIAPRIIPISDLDLNEKELTYLGEILDGSEVLGISDEKRYSLLLSYFYAAGFLTLNEVEEIAKSKMKLHLRIPNKEVGTALSKYLDKFNGTMKLKSSTTVLKTTESIYDDTYVRPVILEKEAIRISHKPRAYRLI